MINTRGCGSICVGLKAEGWLGVCDLLSMLFSKMLDAFALLHTVRIVELDIKVKKPQEHTQLEVILDANVRGA